MGKANLWLDISHDQLNKSGEELCGDTIEINRGLKLITVLSDGLGSGVKASILSKLTVKIAITMLSKESSLEEVIETLASTLPVCKVRKMAYSTFSILVLDSRGNGYLAEFDNPPVLTNCPMTSLHRQIGRYKVTESSFTMRDGDYLTLVSDGVLHAGLGGVWNLGLGWDRLSNYVKRMAEQGLNAKAMVDDMMGLCRKLYMGVPGDDASIIVIRARYPRSLTVMVGPPKDPSLDQDVVRRLVSSVGKKIVCGGTTGNIVANVLGQAVAVNLNSTRKDIPPTGSIAGVDLVTEGLLTLTRVLANLQEDIPIQKFLYKTDGASQLTAALLNADRIRFLVGCATNPAHQDPGMPPLLVLKQQVVYDIITRLRRRGKKVNALYF